MVRIRMQRLGRTHRPFYRINAVDARTKRDGKVIERLGWYNPIEPDEAKQVQLNVERIKDWIARGAQPSETVMDMLGRRDLLDGEMKARWHAGREVDMRRGACKAAVKSIEEAVKELEAIAKSEGESAKPFLNKAKRSLNDAKRTLSAADAEKAQAAAKTATDAAAEVRSAVAAAKAKAEAEAAAAKAAEEAAKAAAEAAKAAEAPAQG